MSDVRALREVESRAPAVTRAVAVLEELSLTSDPLGVSALARRLGLAKSTVANLCAALEAARMVRRVGDGWLLGYKVHELGERFRLGTDVVAEFHRLAAALPVASEETLMLAVLDGTDVRYLGRRDGSQPVRLASDVGLRMPAVITALGKAMLAGLPWDERERRLASIRSLPMPTARSHRTMAALRRELDLTRERGHGVDDGENIVGMSCVGVAVPGWTEPPAAVSATLLSSRATPGRVAALVVDLNVLAGQLARLGDLGHRERSR